MKKALQVNINDTIYFINDDAYLLLQAYLQRLSSTFTGEEGAEIVNDIETRIGELFNDYINMGHNVVDIAYVNKVIDTVGKPEDLGCVDEEVVQETVLTNSPEPPRLQKKLYRDPHDKIFGGVLGGIAHYMNWDATILRVLVVILALTTACIPCVLCYLIAWMIIPAADTPQRQLRMKGEPITVDSIMENIKNSINRSGFGSDQDNYDAGTSSKKKGATGQNFITEVLSVGAKVIFGLLIAIGVLFGCIGLIWLLISLFFVVCGVIMGFANMALMMSLDTFLDPVQFVFMVAIGVVAILICTSLVWLAGCVGFGWRKPSRGTIIVLVSLTIIAITAILLSGQYLANSHLELMPF